MGLAKRVTGKTHDHVPNLIAGFFGDGVFAGVLIELEPVIVELLFLVLFGNDLAQGVGFGGVKIRERHDHLGDVFLINHDAVGFA